MTVNQMRHDISKVYSGVKWKRKVENMSDNQVIAVYYKFERSGKFSERYREKRTNSKFSERYREKREEPTKKKKSDKPGFNQPSGEQISIFDI